MGLGKTYSTKYLADSNNNTGAAGQVLSTTSTGIDWADANTLPGAGLWLEIGNDIYNSNSGNVGIGTTSPGAVLSVRNPTAGASAFSLQHSTTSSIFDFQTGIANVTGDALLIKDVANSYDYLTLRSGNVGIGTDSPGYKLDVSSGSAVGARISTTGFTNLDLVSNRTGGNLGGLRFKQDIDTYQAGEFLGLHGGGFHWKVGDGSASPDIKMALNSVGDLGIGTTSPYEKLEVNGAVAIGTVIDGIKLRLTGTVGEILGLGTASGSWNDLDIRSQAAPQLYLKTDGNVGIGTTSPAKKLHVKESTTATYAAYIENTIAGGDYLAMIGDAGDNVFEFDSGGTGGEAQMKMYSDGVLKNLLDANGTSYFTGNVGIGTTTTGYKLTVEGAIAVQDAQNLWLRGGRVGFENTALNNAAYIYNIGASGSSKLNIADTLYVIEAGNVGIGTTSPGAPLDVQGSTGLFMTRTSSGLASYIENDGGYAAQYLYQIGGGAKIALHTNGSSYFNGGNVGIGMTGPGVPLDVVGDIRTTTRYLISTGTANQNMAIGYWDGSNARIEAGSALPMLITSYQGNIKLGINGGTTMTVQSSNVGIGTTSPIGKLNIQQSTLDIPFLFSGRHNSENEPILQMGESTEFSGSASYGELLIHSYNRDIVFSTQSEATFSNVDAAVMIIEKTNGNVGIGTTTPRPVGSGYKALEIGSPSSGSSLWLSGFSDTTKGYLAMDTGGLNLTAISNHSLTFGTNNSPKMTILSGGNVGIGVTNPLAVLQVNSITASTMSQVAGEAHIIGVNHDLSDTQMGTLNLTSTSRNASTNNQALGSSLTFSQNASKYVDGYEVVIGGIKTELMYTGNMNKSSIMNFYTHTNSGLTPKMSIDATGNVGIGTTSPGAKLEVNGQIIINSTALGGQDAFSIYNSTNQLFHIQNSSTNDEASLLLGANNVIKVKLDTAGDSYLNGGNVGIGTTSPATTLEVMGAIPAANRTVPLDILTITGEGSNLPYTGSGGGIVFKNRTYTYGLLKSARIRSYIDADSGSNRGAGLVFEVTNLNQTYNPSLFLKYNGNVGIGTASPDARLDVNGGLNGAHAIFSGQDGRGLKISTENTLNNDDGVVYDAQTSTGKHLFKVSGSEKMRIDSSGNVGIGVTSFTAGVKLEVAGNIKADGSFYLYSGTTRYFNVGAYSNAPYINTGTSGGTVFIGAPTTWVTNLHVQGTTTATNFILSSDERLKENIEKACDNRIKADWKTFELKTEKGQKRYGVIAQELEKTNPEFVREDTQGFKSVAYIDLLIAKIAELEARLEKAGI